MDREKIEEMIEENIGLVEQVARKHFPDRIDDQDLMQTGLIGLWEAAETWKGKSTFESFARVCIKHNMLDYVRAVRRYGPTIDPAEQEPEPDESAEHVMMERVEISQRIKAAWPPNSRERLILTAIHNGATKQAIAACLGMDTYQVTRIAKRAWDKVKNMD